MATLAVKLSELFLLDHFRCNFVSLYNLNTLWNIITILHSYVEQVMTMCRVQELQLSLSYFLSYFPLMVSYAISCPLHNLKTVWNIIMILHSYVKQVMTMYDKSNFILRVCYLPSLLRPMLPSVGGFAISCDDYFPF